MTDRTPPEGSGAKGPEELRRQIEQTRSQLGDTVEELAGMVDVKGRARARAADLKDKAGAMTVQLRSTAAQARHTARERATKAGHKVHDRATQAGHTVQERATQFSHAETGRIVGEYEPRLAEVLGHVAKDEARHYAFYRSVFDEILQRDPDQALHSASFILPAIDMPGVTMPGFKELAEVIRRTGIYGPRDYLRIVQEQIRYWKIESLQNLNEIGRIAQEKIMGIPARLKRIAELMETRSRAKTFRFEVVFNREFAMD